MGRLGISFLSDRKYSEYAELGDLVDRYDFETVSVYEDLFYQPAWPALFQFATHTRRAILGPAVVNPYLNHPVPVAANIALLDEASGGRAYLGVGRGAFFTPIGVAQPRPLRAIREMVELVQRLLLGDRRPYEGEIFQASPQAYLRFPIPGRRVPILIGTWGEKTAALAGEIADMVKVGGSAHAESAPVYRRHITTGTERTHRVPRDVKLVFGAVTVVDRDRRTAETLARRRAAPYVTVVGRLDPVRRIPDEELNRIEAAMAAGDVERAAHSISHDTLRRFACFGTPGDIVRHMEALFDAGVDLFEFGSPHGVDPTAALRMLGEEVLPAFKD